MTFLDKIAVVLAIWWLVWRVVKMEMRLDDLEKHSHQKVQE